MKVLAMVLAGGQGSRLHPLTTERSKPAVPFGTRYRVADFVLSNLTNSDICNIYLLVQYCSQSLIEHVNKGWSEHCSAQFVTVVPPQMDEGHMRFRGTADAVYQNINLIRRHSPDLVAVFGADHVYRMDVRQMVDFHYRKSAHVSVATLPVPLRDASSFGIVDADANRQIRGFLEKPKDPPPSAADPTRALGSMGNYLFDPEVLIEALIEARQLGETDFGGGILPRLLHTHRVFAYNFGDNHIPGLRSYETQAYWRDVGTLDAFYAANMDLLGDAPALDLFNPRWCIRSSNYQGPSPRIVSAQIDNSTIGAGSWIKGARIRNSILRRETVVEDDVEIDDCVIMDYAIIRRGTSLKGVILDRYNELTPHTRIGFDSAADRARYTVSDGGVVVVPKSPVRPDISRFQT